MKVGQLIDYLRSHDPNKDVVIESPARSIICHDVIGVAPVTLVWFDASERECIRIIPDPRIGPQEGE